MPESIFDIVASVMQSSVCDELEVYVYQNCHMPFDLWLPVYLLRPSFSFLSVFNLFFSLATQI